MRISLKSDETMSVNKEIYEDKENESTEEWTKLPAYFRVPVIRTREEAWTLLLTQISGRPIVAKKRSLNSLIYSVAAGIAILLGFSTWFYFEHETSIWCKPACMQTVNLPDGSQVVLNAASIIRFSKTGWNKTRRIQLEGEAFFKVKKGKRFEVKTPFGKIWVLGTTFNVFARNDHMEVYCETGKVAVATKDTAMITAGMKAFAGKDSPVRIIPVEKKHEGSWQHGDFWFHNAPLREVVAELERQFDVTIRWENVADRFYTGYFNRNSLQEALNTVFFPMQMKYKIENKIVQIIN